MRTTTTAPSTEEAIQDLRAYADGNPDFVQLLESSLNKARNAADGTLNDDLFEALDWPTDILGYYEFLKTFLRWIPQQSPLPAWNGGNGSQEVYDRLCHFYFLIDQPVGPDNVLIQNDEYFSDFLIAYADAWGDFLNTPDSFTEEMMESYWKYSPEFRVCDSIIGGRPNNEKQSWDTFNEFFARSLNPGLRPIADPASNKTVALPADCTYKDQYPIAEDSSVSEVVLKQTHRFGNIKDLLEGSAYADAFAGGTFVHYFLGPYSYHRFHTPVSGLVAELTKVHGKTFLDVNLEDTPGQFSAPDKSIKGKPPVGYEFSQARGYLIIDTSNSPAGDVGLVAAIPVGMCQVSSVLLNQPILGQHVEKGTEFGHFEFGGSDIILLFQKGRLPADGINTDKNSYRYYGTSVSICPNSPKAWEKGKPVCTIRPKTC